MRIPCLATQLVLVVQALAQTPLCWGEVHHLQSTALGEDRPLNIVLPSGYIADDTSRYPVIFLLDGSLDEDLVHVAGALQFATMEWIAWQQPSILVGVGNVDRKRDFTFPTTVAKDKELYPTTGGSANFIRFLAEELVPYIDARFRTKPDRLLIGQSLGGLLATELLLEQPGLFQRYVIASPSLWWDNGSLLKRLAGSQPEERAAPHSVFIAVGKEGKVMVQGAKQLHALLDKNRTLQVQYQYMPRFDHANILHQAVLDGFRWMGERRGASSVRH